MKRVMREVLPTEGVWDQLSGHVHLKRLWLGRTALFTQKH
jgi:hypothetical protein